MSDRNTNNTYSFILALIASIGGLLFGFNAGIISGALPFLENSWGGLSTQQSDSIILSTLFGATIGALLSIRLSNSYGRRVLLIAASIIYTVGAVMSGAATSISFLLIGRLMLGIAMGISSCIVPMYISEISHPNNRGAMVSVFQLMITIGILLSFFSNTIIADEHDPFSWRSMFYLGTFPSILFFIGTFFLPETPYFLVYKNRIADGRQIMRKINPFNGFESIKDSIKKQKEKQIWNANTKKLLFIVVGLMFFQQFVGINTIIYFIPTLFSDLSGSYGTVNITFSIGVINVLSSILALVLVDKLGRRKLYFIGLFGMAITLVILGVIFYTVRNIVPELQWFALFLVLLYIMFFAISLGPLSWLILSEVFPFKSKGFGMGIGAFSNWLFNAILTIAILKYTWIFSTGSSLQDIKQAMENYGFLFIIFATIALLAIVWGLKNIPETKGKSLEEIEKLWLEGKQPNEF